MGCPFAGGSVGVACQRHGRGAAGPSGRARPRARVAGMPRGPARPRAAPERARPAAPGALGTMSGEGAILVPRAAAWRLRHAAARGLSPWRRATPGIAILVFARPPPNSWPRGNTWAAWGAPPLSSRAMSARACLSTSGRLHSDFMRLLYFLAECVGGLLQTDPQERAKTATADKQASDYFTALGYEPHKEEFCHRRGVYFHQHRCTIGLECAQAVAIRVLLLLQICFRYVSCLLCFRSGPGLLCSLVLRLSLAMLVRAGSGAVSSPEMQWGFCVRSCGSVCNKPPRTARTSTSVFVNPISHHKSVVLWCCPGVRNRRSSPRCMRAYINASVHGSVTIHVNMPPFQNSQ